MAIELWLELGSGVRIRVMVRAWVRVRFRVVFCSSIAYNLTHSALQRCGMGMAVRLGVWVSGYG